MSRHMPFPPQTLRQWFLLAIILVSLSYSVYGVYSLLTYTQPPAPTKVLTTVHAKTVATENQISSPANSGESIAPSK